MKMKYSALTDVGMLRKENQDSYGVCTEMNFYFVCDGMGGGAAGDFASREAVEIVQLSMRKLSPESKDAVVSDLPDAITDEFQYPVAAIRLANRALWNLADKYPKLSGMGTTFVGVLFDPRTSLLHLYHVGDSRVYRLRKGTLVQLTHDHSKINELIEQGKMREDEVKTAEIQSMITRALGTAARVRIDYRAEPVLPGDRYILCSDGLNGELDDTDIQRIMEKSGSADAAAKNLVAAANAAGGKDNTTVITLDAVPEDDERQANDGGRAVAVTTVDEETTEETVVEDRIVKEMLKRSAVAVPRSARQRSLLGNPLFISVVLTAAIIGVGVLLTRMPKQGPDTVLTDLAGKVTGLRVDIRVPSDEQLAMFKKSEDTVAKLQMIQDWLHETEKNTSSLANVEILLQKDGKEQFRGLSGASPLEVKLEPGMYTMQARFSNYQVINERLETKNTIAVSVEHSATMKPVIVLMVPANN